MIKTVLKRGIESLNEYLNERGRILFDSLLISLALEYHQYPLAAILGLSAIYNIGLHMNEKLLEGLYCDKCDPEEVEVFE